MDRIEADPSNPNGSVLCRASGRARQAGGQHGQWQHTGTAVGLDAGKLMDLCEAIGDGRRRRAPSGPSECRSRSGTTCTAAADEIATWPWRAPRLHFWCTWVSRWSWPVVATTAQSNGSVTEPCIESVLAPDRMRGTRNELSSGVAKTVTSRLRGPVSTAWRLERAPVAVLLAIENWAWIRSQICAVLTLSAAINWHCTGARPAATYWALNEKVPV